jgi:hypothetical protein
VVSRDQREREAAKAYGWRFPKEWGYPPREQVEAILRRGDPEEAHRYVAAWAAARITEQGYQPSREPVHGMSARRQLERRCAR